MAVSERIQWAVSCLEISPGDSVLEIGCGTGGASCLIAGQLAEGGRVIALDRSKHCLAKAAALAARQGVTERVEFIRASLAQAALAEDTFDKVFAFNVNLFWSEVPGEELALIRKVLRPGGQLYVFHQPPDETTREVAVTTRKNLRAHGFEVVSTVYKETRMTCTSCIIAREAAEAQ